MLDTRRSGDVASGIVLALLGLAAMWGASEVGEGAGGHLHPRSFPILIGALLALGGGGLAAWNVLDPSGGDETVDWPERGGWRRWLVALGALAVYVAVAPVLGFLVASFLFVAGLIWYLGRGSPWVAAACALALVAFVYAVFVWLLELTLPEGLLAVVVLWG